MMRMPGRSLAAEPCRSTSRKKRRRGSGAIVALASLMLAACGTKPTEPDPTPTPTPTVATVAVTSAVDTVMVVGRSAQLTAVGRDNSGTALTATFTWASSNTAVATVNGSGLVQAVAAGPVTITATADGVNGSVTIRAAAADVGGVVAVLADPFVANMVARLDVATKATVDAALAACNTGSTSGNVIQVATCIATALGVPPASGAADDGALLAVLDIFLNHAYQVLNLGR